LSVRFFFFRPVLSRSSETPQDPVAVEAAMVDYSKWDKLECSDSEDEERPRVEKFDSAQSVSFGGDLDGDVEIVPESAHKEALERENREANAASNPAPKDPKPPAPKPAAPKVVEWTRNGGKTDRYLWSQTKDTVTVAAFVPQDSKGKDVTMRVSGTHFLLWCQGISIEGELFYPVVKEEDPLDWELTEAEGRRVVTMTFRKDQERLPGVLWWKSFLKGDEEIAIETVKDRKQTPGLNELWKQAHAQFKQKVRNVERQTINADGSCDPLPPLDE